MDGSTHTTKAATWLGMVYLMALAQGFLWTVMPRHLEALGWTSAVIGALYGSRKLFESLSMGGWASLATEPKATLKLVRVQLSLGALCMLALPWIVDDYGLWMCVLGSGLVMGGALPLVDTLSMYALGAHRFGQIRAWGSLGYGGMALISSYWGMTRGYLGLAQLVPWGMAILSCAAAAAIWGLKLPEAPATEDQVKPVAKPGWSSLLKLLGRPRLAALMGLSCLHWALMAPYNMFFVSLCERKGVGAWAPGLSVALGISAEILVLWKAGALMQRWRPSSLFALALSVTAARWLLTGALSGPLVIALQLLHGLSFGLFFTTAIALLQRELEPSLRARGQASFYLVVFSLGSLVGESLAGFGRQLWGVERLFMAAGLVQTLLIPLSLLYALWSWRAHKRVANLS